MFLFREILMLVWPGRRCPNCAVKPGKNHRVECPTGKWDGGVWA